MDRRTFLLLTGVWPLFAASDPAAEIYNLFGKLATDLSTGDAKAFMKPFDSSMPDYGRLQSYIYALVAQDTVSASISVVKNEGDEQHRTVELNWHLVIISQQPTGPTVRRKEQVTCQLELHKKKWVIVKLTPLSFFAPPTV
jgi:hypothetical protein